MGHREESVKRQKWRKRVSPVTVEVVYEGLVFTVAVASIQIPRRQEIVYYEAEGISRLSPLDDDPKHDLPLAGREHAIQQAIRALWVRVWKERRSNHHYRG